MRQQLVNSAMSKLSIYDDIFGLFVLTFSGLSLKILIFLYRQRKFIVLKCDFQMRLFTVYVKPTFRAHSFNIVLHVLGKYGRGPNFMVNFRYENFVYHASFCLCEQIFSINFSKSYYFCINNTFFCCG